MAWRRTLQAARSGPWILYCQDAQHLVKANLHMYSSSHSKYHNAQCLPVFHSPTPDRHLAIQCTPAKRVVLRKTNELERWAHGASKRHLSECCAVLLGLQPVQQEAQNAELCCEVSEARLLHSLI